MPNIVIILIFRFVMVNMTPMNVTSLLDDVIKAISKLLKSNADFLYLQ